MAKIPPRKHPQGSSRDHGVDKRQFIPAVPEGEATPMEVSPDLVQAAIKYIALVTEKPKRGKPIRHDLALKDGLIDIATKVPGENQALVRGVAELLTGIIIGIDDLAIGKNSHYCKELVGASGPANVINVTINDMVNIMLGAKIEGAEALSAHLEKVKVALEKSGLGAMLAARETVESPRPPGSGGWPGGQGGGGGRRGR